MLLNKASKPKSLSSSAGLPIYQSFLPDRWSLKYGELFKFNVGVKHNCMKIISIRVFNSI